MKIAKQNLWSKVQIYGLVQNKKSVPQKIETLFYFCTEGRLMGLEPTTLRTTI